MRDLLENDAPPAPAKTGKGIGGHHSADAGSVVWLTPRPILDALGPFDLDPCSAPDPTFWPTADHHITWPAQDGLTMPWTIPGNDSPRIWCNPPYSNGVIAQWMARMADHGHGTALIFARTETEFFFRSVWERADAALFLEGRLYFHHPDGRRASANSGAPSVLCAYGPEDVDRLMTSKLKGQLIGLKRPVLIQLALADRDPVAAQTWREIVAETMTALGGRASLQEPYARLEDHPRAAANTNWRAKVRQTCGRMGLQRKTPGVYAAA